MKKRLFALIIAIVLGVSVSCHAASYTLPEKMRNQLAIGSGLKGNFRIESEGDFSRTPFLNAVSDADFALRGIVSGDDLHYYVFQSDANENQTALSELYRKDGVYYFRSDMVQGKILALPSLERYIDSIFPVKGDNPTLSSALSNLFTLSSKDRNEKWSPVLTKYQNSLEMWLADYTVQADVVKQENGSSALDFTYVIPVQDLKDRIVSLIGDFSSDQDMLALVDSIMTAEQKNLYVNGDLLFYYQEALNSLDLHQDILMNKRVSAMGDVLSSSLSLPLDSATTGYDILNIENKSLNTVYQVKNDSTEITLVLPAQTSDVQDEYQKSIWFTRYSSDVNDQRKDSNIAIRIDVVKQSEQSEDEEERSHLKEHYSLTVVQDGTYLPEGTELSDFSPTKEINAALDLHYYSKYSQNSATTLEVSASVLQGEASVSVEGKFKTAAPWIFMPFEVIDPVNVEADLSGSLLSYFTDWISNASSMIRHNASDMGKIAESQPSPAETAATAETGEPSGSSAAGISDGNEQAPVSGTEGQDTPHQAGDPSDT